MTDPAGFAEEPGPLGHRLRVAGTPRGNGGVQASAVDAGDAPRQPFPGR